MPTRMQMDAMRRASSWHAPARLRGKLASPWNRDHAIPPTRAVSQAIPTPFAANHRAVVRQHQLEPSACVVYDASGLPIACIDKITRTRHAL